MQACPDMGYFKFQTGKSGILLGCQRIALRRIQMLSDGSLLNYLLDKKTTSNPI